MTTLSICNATEQDLNNNNYNASSLSTSSTTLLLASAQSSSASAASDSTRYLNDLTSALSAGVTTTTDDILINCLQHRNNSITTTIITTLDDTSDGGVGSISFGEILNNGGKTIIQENNDFILNNDGIAGGVVNNGDGVSAAVGDGIVSSVNTINSIANESINLNILNYTTINEILQNVSANNVSSSRMGNLQISLYAIIFLLAIVGNLLVILTLVQNRRMRTITNLFLLNLAISDILLGVLCMPATLVGSLLRDFIFGRFMCKVLPYLQACSISVSAWTLVAISCERYYAICHPLRSRTWQTLKHAYKLIALIWIGSLFLMSPIAYLSKLIPTAKGGHKCREEWPETWKQPYEKIFNIYLDIILLIIPVLVLTGTYTLISRTLWHGMREEKQPKGTQSTDNLMEVFINKNGSPSNRSFVSYRTTSKDNLNLVGNLHPYNGNNSFMQNSMLIKEFSYSTRRKQGLRRTNIEKSLQNKKRVIKMLFIVVLEFFICWTPLYVINTIALFNSTLVYSSIGYYGISFFQLLAYSSSCCNPITYCFMNRGFRKAFLNLFRCFKRFRSPKRKISIGGGGTQETDLEISRLQCQRLCTDSTISY